MGYNTQLRTLVPCFTLDLSQASYSAESQVLYHFSTCPSSNVNTLTSPQRCDTWPDLPVARHSSLAIAVVAGQLLSILATLLRGGIEWLLVVWSQLSSLQSATLLHLTPTFLCSILFPLFLYFHFVHFHFVPMTCASTLLWRIQPDLPIAVLATSLREGDENAFCSSSSSPIHHAGAFDVELFPLHFWSTLEYLIWPQMDYM